MYLSVYEASLTIVIKDHVLVLYCINNIRRCTCLGKHARRYNPLEIKL